MSQDDYKPRKHDHLVEPVFSGLGVGDEARPDDEAIVFTERLEVTLVETQEGPDGAGRPRRRAYRWSSKSSRFWRRVSEFLRGG